LGLAPYFSGEILGDSEIVISSYALRHLGVSSDRKEKVEVYFDILGLIDIFMSVSGNSAKSSTEEEQTQGLNNEMNDALKELLPSSDQMISIMKDTYQLPINDDNTLKVDIRDILS
jgi:hypothetical protein